jgi:hypothetical protein
MVGWIFIKSISFNRISHKHFFDTIRLASPTEYPYRSHHNSDFGHEKMKGGMNARIQDLNLKHPIK